MQAIQVGELKGRFSEVLAAVRSGQTIIVSYGRKREHVAALVPIDQVRAGAPRQLGVLAGTATATFAADFSISDDELLGA